MPTGLITPLLNKRCVVLVLEGGLRTRLEPCGIIWGLIVLITG